MINFFLNVSRISIDCHFISKSYFIFLFQTVSLYLSFIIFFLQSRTITLDLNLSIYVLRRQHQLQHLRHNFYHSNNKNNRKAKYLALKSRHKKLVIKQTFIIVVLFKQKSYSLYIKKNS